MLYEKMRFLPKPHSHVIIRCISRTPGCMRCQAFPIAVGNIWHCGSTVNGSEWADKGRIVHFRIAEVNFALGSIPAVWPRCYIMPRPRYNLLYFRTTLSLLCSGITVAFLFNAHSGRHLVIDHCWPHHDTKPIRCQSIRQICDHLIQI